MKTEHIWPTTVIQKSLLASATSIFLSLSHVHAQSLQKSAQDSYSKQIENTVSQDTEGELKSEASAEDVIAHVNLSMNVPSKEKIEKIKPILNVSMALQNNQKQIRGTIQHSNCYDTLGTRFQNQYNEIISDIQNNQYSNFSDYLSAIPALTQGWSLDEKKCLIASNVGNFADNYESNDQFSSMTMEQLYNNYQDGLSTGVCVHLHHIGALVGQAMGLQCGTSANVWMVDNDRANHAVTLCTDPVSRSYFMVNYNTYYDLDGKLYSEAIDSLNYTLGPMNNQGSIISCFGNSDKSIDNCVHEYIPASTRWSLYTISKAVDSIHDKNGTPFNLEMTNTGLKFNIQLIEKDQESSSKKNGTVTYRESGKGLMAMFNSYRDTQFISAGIAFSTKSKNSSGQSHQGSIFIGPFFYRQNNPEYYSEQKFQDVAGLIMLSNLEKTISLNDKNKISGALDLSGSIDNFIQSAGTTNQLSASFQHQLNKNVSLKVEQVGAINGNVQNNHLAAHFERTTMSVNTDFQNKDKDKDYENYIKQNLKAHILYSGYVPSTMAIEFEQEIIQVLNAFGQDRLLELSLSMDLGHTFTSRDPYYNSLDSSKLGFFYYKVDAELGVKLSKRATLTLYGHLNSSDMPSWFGDTPLIIDPEITPERQLPGIEAGARLEIKLGKKQKLKNKK